MGGSKGIDMIVMGVGESRGYSEKGNGCIGLVEISM